MKRQRVEEEMERVYEKIDYAKEWRGVEERVEIREEGEGECEECGRKGREMKEMKRELEKMREKMDKMKEYMAMNGLNYDEEIWG